MNDRKDLIEAYKNTDYVIKDNSFRVTNYKINIGRIHSDLDNLISPYENWVYITGWNPFSKELTKEENQRRNKALLYDIGQLELTAYNGYGLSKNPDFPWKELSFFVPGMNRTDAIFLGNKYEQNAIVFGEKGKAVELVLLVDI